MLEKKIVLQTVICTIKLHLIFISHQPGQNSTAAADIWGSAVSSQPPAKTERLRGLVAVFKEHSMHFRFWNMLKTLFFLFICELYARSLFFSFKQPARRPDLAGCLIYALCRRSLLVPNIITGKR